MDKRKRRAAMMEMMMTGGKAATYSISGFVYDADGTTAVASATVTLGALSTTSGVDGSYTLTGIAPGASGNLTATKAGYSWAVISIAAMSGNLTGHNFTNAWWATGGIAAFCAVAYAPYGAASLADSYVNLANPGTNNAAPGVAPTHGSTFGWSGDGTQWLDSGYAPEDNASLVFQCTHQAAIDAYLLGASNASPAYFGVQLRRAVGASSTQHTWYNNGSSTVSLVADHYISNGAGVLGPGKAYWQGVAEAVGSLGHAAMTVSLKIFRMGGLALTGGGKIQHLAVYKSGVSEAQMLAVTRSMKRFLPLVVYDGDSLTYGTTATQAQSYPQVIMDGRPEAWDWYNLAVGGYTWTSLDVNKAIAKYDAKKPKNILIVWCGTNDLKNGDTAATVYGRAAAYCQAAKNAGFRVVILTTIPRAEAGLIAGYETQRLAYNNLLRANYATIGNALVDMAANEKLDDPHDATYFNADLVHLTPAGYAEAASLVNSQLDA